MAVPLRRSSRMDVVPPLPIPGWVLRVAARIGLLLASSLPRTAGDVDRLVLARARRGDHRAFAQIVDHYDHRLRGLAFRLLGDRDRMDDVLQEAYVKAFRSLPKFKGDSGLGTWLYRIVYNACVDDLRSRKATTPLDDQQETADPRPTRPMSPPAATTWPRPSTPCRPTRRRPSCWSTPTGSTTTRRPRFSAWPRAPSAPASPGPGPPCARSWGRSDEGPPVTDERDEALGRVLRGLEVPDHGPDFHARLLSRLEQEAARHPGSARRPRTGWRSPYLLTAMVAAAAVIVLATTAVLTGDGPGPGPGAASPNSSPRPKSTPGWRGHWRRLRRCGASSRWSARSRSGSAPLLTTADGPRGAGRS